MTPEEFFWARFMDGPIPDHAPDLGPCRVWPSSLNPVTGYGQVWDWRKKRSTTVHQLAYELTHGPTPDGLQIDHLCRVRPCGRVDHLEAVPAAVNIQRGVEARGVQFVRACACGAPISRRNRQCRECYLAGGPR